MAQKTKLYVNVPADIGSASWGQQVLKSYLHNAKIIYKRENKKLLSQMKTYGSKIYDLVIAEFYKSYTPAVYDRHGDKKGFNLYRANNFVFTGLQSGNIPSSDSEAMYGFEFQINKLLPYHSWYDKKQYGKYDDGSKIILPRMVRRSVIFQMVLMGVRAFVYSYNKHGGLVRNMRGDPVLRHYEFNVSYGLGDFKHTFKGAPWKIFLDTADYLVKQYNSLIVRRIRKDMSNIPIRWIN